MRKDPPFDTEYIYSTYILERAEDAGVLVVNRPQGLRDMNEKVYTAWFPQCCAPTLITRDMADMAAFLRRARQGRGQAPATAWAAARSSCSSRPTRTPAWCSRPSPTTAGALRSCSATCPRSPRPATARVLLVDGEPVPYALARMPAADDHRGNLAAGAKGVGRPLNDRDRWLAGQIGPTLAGRGMLFVGLDVIGGFVTEINVTSPTGIRELDKQFGTDIGELLMAAVERRLAGRASGAAR